MMRGILVALPVSLAIYAAAIFTIGRVFGWI